MSKFKKNLLAMMLGGVTILSVCGGGGDISVYRYRIAVEVETPRGLRTGSAVREITYKKTAIKLPDSAAAFARQRGEAVAVDLPNGETLFALLPVNPYETLQAAFGNDSDKTLSAGALDKRVVELKPIPGRISAQSGYPKLVRFRDIRDRWSVEVVPPDALDRIFGAGVKIRRITVQMTDDPVTEGIRKRLPAPDSKGFYNWDGRSNPAELSTINISEFGTGKSNG